MTAKASIQSPSASIYNCAEMDERYRLSRLFSRGGMAEVYLGTASGAEGFEKRVAIKRILPHLAQDEQMARMFLAEAKLATFLNHQNIVQVFDMGRGPDGLFIVMELIDGWDLGVIIDRASEKKLVLTPPLAAFITSQVMAGLCHAYRQTHQGKPIIVAHRDLSPSNILISAEGEVKVADFGIARLEAFNRTEPGTFKGKVAYSAPEILRGQPATIASDQFSLGIVLQEMLTGKHPFGHFENTMAYAGAILNQSPEDLPNAPIPMVDLVRRALSKSPTERFESPEAFAKALARFLASTGTPTSTHELAEFLKALILPPLPSQLGADETLVRGSVRSSFSLQRFQSAPPNAGPAIDATSLRIAAPSNVPWATPSGPSPAWPPAEDLNKDWTAAGPTLDLTGQLEGHPRLRPAAVRAAPPPVVVKEAPLELARPLRSEAVASGSNEIILAEPVPTKPRRSAAWWVLGGLAGLVGVIALALYLNAPAVYRLIPDPLAGLLPQKLSKAISKEKTAPRPVSVLRVESEPSGAMIQIGDQQLGETPMFTENFYPHSEIEITLSLKGYQPWKGKFLGGEMALVKAKLKRR